MADALDDGVDGVAQGLEGLAGEAAGAGFMAGEAALVEQEDVLARLGEVVGRGATGGAGTGDENIDFTNHAGLSLFRSTRDGRLGRVELWRGTRRIA